MSLKYPEWFSAAYKEFLARTNKDAKELEYFVANREKRGLTGATSFLSIGPGTGFIDSAIIRECMPCLKSYTAIDVQECAIEATRERLQQDGLADKLKTKLVVGDSTQWSGPDEPVDVILMDHMLYHITEAETRVQLLRNCAKWLQPGGRIIILIMQAVEYCPWDLYAAKFKIDDALLRDVHVREDIKIARFSRIQSEDCITRYIDYRNRTKPLMSFFLGKDASDEEAKALDEYFGEILPPGQINHDRIVVFTLCKTDYNKDD